MGTIECSQPASKSSWYSQDFGDISMVLKMAHLRTSTGPRWVKYPRGLWFNSAYNSPLTGKLGAALCEYFVENQSFYEIALQQEEFAVYKWMYLCCGYFWL